MKNRRWQKIRQWLLYQLISPLRWLFDRWMADKKLVVIYCVAGDGIGDALAISTILKCLHEQSGYRGIVFSYHPDLFLHNPMVVCNISSYRLSSLSRSLLKMLLRALRGKHVICFGGEVWSLGTSPWSNHSIHDMQKPDGWVWLRCLLPDGHAFLDDKVFHAPAVFFSTDEITAYEKKFSDVPRPFVIIKGSTGTNRASSTRLKDWDVEKFTAVIAQHPEIFWVQVGQHGEPRVTGSLDRLGTTTVRETLYLLSQARLLLAPEGFLTHAAAAFDIPCVVPFSGMHDYRGLLYARTLPVVATPQPPCAPCWGSHCHVPGKPCTADISVAQVSAAVGQGLNQQTER